MIGRVVRPSGVRTEHRGRLWVGVAGAVALSVAPGVLASDEDANAAAPPAGACAEALAGRVQHRYDSVRDLAAHFEQQSERVAMGGAPSQTLRSEGKVTFAKPGRMRWTYLSPQRSVVISDGETLWIYDPEAEEAQHLALGRGFLSGAAIQFLLGRGDLLREFKASSGPCDETPTRLILSPRADAPYERLEVLADPETGEVKETVIADLFGNVTRVRFSDVRRNTNPDPSLFRFVPPPGVRVLELPAAQ